MLTGVETAGLCLAAFPILVSALETYREGFKPLREWWMFRTEFITFIDDLDTQKNLFYNNLEKLLIPFIESDNEMYDLLNDPTGALWQRPGLEERLQARLSNSYDNYMRTIHKMLKITEELKRLLGIEGQKVTWLGNDTSGWDYQMKRIRISFSKKKFRRVKILAGYNDDLAKLLGSTHEISVLRERRKSLSPPITLFQKIQDYAFSLHLALKTKWCCECRVPHDVKLQLDKRLKSGCAPVPHLKARFNLGETSNGSNTRLAQDIEIRVFENSDLSEISAELRSHPGNYLSEARQQFELQHNVATETARIGLTDRMVSSRITSAIQPAPESILKSVFPFRSAKGKKQTRFEVAVHSKQPLLSVSSTITSVSHEPNEQEIYDICTYLQNWGTRQDKLHYLIDEQKRKHVLHPMSDQSLPSEPFETATLESLLSHKSENGKSTSTDGHDVLTRQERLTIAAILASSVLQLHSTPWLTDSWTKRDIIFLRTSDESRRPLIEYPYISQSFPLLKNNAIPRSSDRNSSNPKEYDCRKYLFSLGVLLLELCFGEALEDQKFRKLYYGPNNEPNDLTDRCTALAWHKKVQGECGDGLSDAIRRCIDCSFGPKPDFADKDFRAAVFAGVVEPVEDLLKYWPVPGA